MRGLILASILAYALCHPHTGDDKNESGVKYGMAHRPPFFDKVSPDAREEYLDNLFHHDKPRSKIYEDELQWGRNYGIEEEVRTHQTARGAFFLKHADRVDEAVQKLPESLVKMRSYFRDLTLTHDERAKAIHRMFKNMTPELRALVHASRPSVMETLTNGDLFPSHKRRKAMKEALLKESQV